MKATKKFPNLPPPPSHARALIKSLSIWCDMMFKYKSCLTKALSYASRILGSRYFARFTSPHFSFFRYCRPGFEKLFCISFFIHFLTKLNSRIFFSLGTGFNSSKDWYDNMTWFEDQENCELKRRQRERHPNWTCDQHSQCSCNNNSKW